ncbi:hypothetical protein DOY81_013127 [Sarcophaga bullata]|nr:hypothetical protein DOY81_013127 [Sarcophaga bullata]
MAYHSTPQVKLVFRQFNWKHVALLVDRSDLFSLTVGKNLEYGLRQEGLLSFVRELNGNEQEPYEIYLRDASMYARVVILSVRGTLVRKFMLAAYALGMTNGDWVFLDVEIFQSSYWGDHDWEMGDPDDSRARKAYEALVAPCHSCSHRVPNIRALLKMLEKWL